MIQDDIKKALENAINNLSDNDYMKRERKHKKGMVLGTVGHPGEVLGTVLAFMMSVTALSLPEFMILKRVMKIKLILIFAIVVTVGIIITGYIFNFILG